MIHKNLLVTVNCGDCRAVLSRGGQAVQLTTDHRPELPSERLRIEKAAGFVVNGRVQGKLAVSRAFGDFEFKGMNEQSLGKGIGKIVTCMPEVVVSQIDFGIDEFLVIGCDGLFEAFSNPDIVKETRNRLKRMKVTEQDPCRVVKDLVTEAVHTRRTLDNVSALLITFCAGLA
jgi:protein phosphatase 2C family protein 2/3